MSPKNDEDGKLLRLLLIICLIVSCISTGVVGVILASEMSSFRSECTNNMATLRADIVETINNLRENSAAEHNYAETTADIRKEEIVEAVGK